MLARLGALLRIQPPVVDNRGLLWGSGADYPTLGSDGYQIGCIWCNTTGAAGTSLYVNEGSVTSCDFVAVDTTAGASAGAINFDDNVTGPLISIETTDPTNNSYLTPFLITGTYSSTCALAIQLSATNQRPVSFLFDDGGAVLGAGNYRAVLSRVLLCSTQTGQVAIRAIRGQIKAKDGLALNIGANEFNLIAGVEGYMELAGATARTIGANTRVAASAALLEINQDITLTAGGKCVGVLVQLAQTTVKTVGGIGTCGVAVGRIDSDHATHQALWGTGFVTGDGDCTTGMLIGTATTGISIGACTDGITIGACTDGITLTGVTAYAIDIQTTGVFRMGVEGTGVPVDNTYPYGLEIHTKTTTDFAQPATGVSAGIYSRYEHSTDQVTATGHAAVFAKFRVKKDLKDGVHAASYNYVEVSGGAATDIGGTVTTTTCAGLFSIETDSGFILSTGHLNGIVVDSSIHATGTFTGTISGIRICKSAKAWPTGIAIEASATETGITIGTCTTGISVGNCSTAGITVESSDDKVAGYNAIYSHIDTGGVTGWNAGRVTASRFKVTLDGSGNVGNVSAIWGGLNSGGTYTGLGQATCAAFEVVTTHVGSHPTAILYLTSAPGTSASHATMPYLVFAENPTGTGSNILFEVGSAPAGYTCTTGAGTLYHAETLQIKVNGNARYLPMSTAQTSFTTAYQIILTTTDPATATNGIYSNLVETATWTGSITPLRCRNTITTAAAGGNCYGGWFNMLFDSGAAPTGLGLSCGLYVEAGSNVASTGVSSVLMATLLGDADGGVTASPILTLADASTLKTAVVMEFGFNAGGTLLSTAADVTTVAFRTGGNAATNISFKQGLRVMCNGAYYYIGLIAEGDWSND